MTELELDYLTDPSVWYVDIIAKAVKISGSGSARTAYPWVITQAALPDLFLDADGAAPAVLGEIRAGSPDGSVQYPIHIEKLTLNSNPALSVVEIWVNVGTVDADDVTGVPVTLFWNKAGKTQPAASDPFGQHDVYNAEFAYWYHGNEDPSDGLTDATGNARASIDLGSMTSGDQVAAKVGNGIDFDGSNDGIEIATPAFPAAGNDFVLGRWVKPRTDTGFPALGGIRQSDAGAALGCFFDWSDSVDKFRFVVRDTTQTGNAAATGATTIVYNTNFYHVVGRFDDSAFTADLFLNGAIDATGTGSGTRFTQIGSEYIGVGWFSGANVDSLNGILDEMWRFDGFIADDDIATMYQNQNDPADFWDHTATPAQVGDSNPPEITSISPSEGVIGTIVTINGLYFTSVDAIEFGGVDAPDFTIVSDTEITVEVPTGALSGDVVVFRGLDETPYTSFYVLPDIPADGYQIELFQIRINDAETDIEQVVSTYRNYFTEGILDDTINFIPDSFSVLERSIETEEGVYSLGNVELTASLLEADYFNDYTEYVFEPYVCVIRDANGVVLFHGPVDPESCTYNAGSKKTAFRVLSWEVLLEATNSPARYVYETTFARDYSDAYALGVNSTVYIKKVINGVDMTTVAVPGSVLVFDTPAGEYRAIVYVTFEDGDDLALVIAGEPTLYLTSNLEIDPGSCTVTTVGSGGLTFKRLKMEFQDAALWALLESAPDARDGNELLLNVDVGTKSYTLPLLNSTIDTSGAWYFLDDDRITIRLYHNINAADITEFTTVGCFISITTNTDITAGESVRILGPDMYGFMDDGPLGIFKHYDIDGGIMQGIFSLPELGVLPYIVDTFDFPDGYDRTIDKWAELPPRLLEALRQIQNTHYTFLNLDPRTEGGLPRLTIVVRPRTDANTTDAPVIDTVTDIIEWKENAANLTPTAVIVKPHIEYFKPVGDIETIGFYYDGVDDADPNVTGKPFGGRVVEITVNVTPAYSGQLFAGDGPVVRNDARLRAIAEQFYAFYSNLARPCEFVVQGTPPVDWLTKFLAIAEIDDPITGELFERTVFVTSVSVDPNSNRTTVRGRIGEYTNAVSQNPVAIVDGQLIWNDGDDSGDEDVRLSAVRSYDPQGDPLTFEWVEGMTTLSTSSVLDVTLSVGDHEITLTVTDPDMNTDSVDLLIKVTPQAETPPVGDPEQAALVVSSYAFNGEGDLFLTLTGNVLTRTLDGIKIRTATTQGGLAAASDSDYDNPQVGLEIISAIPTGETRWVRVTLVNDFDGSDSDNVWEFGVTNNSATTALIIPSNTAPADTADSTGVLGEIRYDGSYIYVKGPSGWLRASLSTF